jgi:hypothetical protein
VGHSQALEGEEDVTETEIEAIVVRLTGDGSPYQLMMEKAAKSTEQTNEIVKKATNEIKGMKEKLEGFANAAVSTLAAGKVKSFLTSAFNSFASAETTMLRLKQAIEDTGQPIDSTVVKFKEFAARMLEMTGTTKGTTLSLIEEAMTMGIVGDAATRVAQNAIGLAARSHGTSASSQLRSAIALETQNAAMVRHVRGLEGVRDQTEKLAKLQEFATKGMKLAETITKSTSGVMAVFGDTVALVTKQFGELVAGAVKPVVEWMTKLIDKFTALDENSKKIIVTVAFMIASLTMIGPAMKAFAFIQPIIASIGTGFVLLGQAILFLLNPLKLVMGTFTVLGTVMSIAFSPITLLIAGIGTLVALLVNKLGGIEATWVKVRDGLIEGWNRVKNAALVAWDWIKEKGQQFWDWIQPAIQTMQAAFGVTWEAIKEYAVPVWETIKEGVIQVWEWMKKVWDVSVGWVKDFVSQNKETIFTTGLIVSGVLALYGAFKLVIFSLGVINGLMTLFHIQQIAGLAWWAVWKVTVFTAMSLWTVGLLTVKAAIWAVNAALTVTNALIAVATITASTLALGALAAAFTVVYAAISGVYAAGAALFHTLADFPTLVGPIRAIGELFGEWGGIIQDIVRAAKTDMPLAWKLAKLGAELAVERIKQLWPPLWSFLRRGFLELWDLVSTSFALMMESKISKVKHDIGEALNLLGLVDQEAADDQEAYYQSNIKKELEAKQAATRKFLEFLAKEFDQARAVGDNATVQRLRAEYEALRAQIKPAEDKAANKADELKKKNEGLASSYAAINKEIHKFDAALSGSAEALGRMEAQRNKFAIPLTGGGFPVGGAPAVGAAGGPPPVPVAIQPPPGAAGGLPDMNRTNMILDEIREVTKAILGQMGGRAAPAGLGGAAP